MPLQLHPVEKIVNVHWASGLAVIFGERDEDAPKQEAIEQEKE